MCYIEFFFSRQLPTLPAEFHIGYLKLKDTFTMRQRNSSVMQIITTAAALNKLKMWELELKESVFQVGDEQGTFAVQSIDDFAYHIPVMNWSETYQLATYHSEIEVKVNVIVWGEKGISFTFYLVE